MDKVSIQILNSLCKPRDRKISVVSMVWEKRIAFSHDDQLTSIELWWSTHQHLAMMINSPASSLAMDDWGMGLAAGWADIKAGASTATWLAPLPSCPLSPPNAATRLFFPSAAKALASSGIPTAADYQRLQS